MNVYFVPSFFIFYFNFLQVIFNKLSYQFVQVMEIGFSIPSYFNTCFNQYYGYPPREVKFRNALNREDSEEIQTSNNNAGVIAFSANCAAKILTVNHHKLIPLPDFCHFFPPIIGSNLLSNSVLNLKMSN